MKFLLISLCITLAMTGCHVKSKKFWANESKKVESCRNKWVYQDLSEEHELTVLSFSAKSRHSLVSFPNFLIGITETNDTIAFLDKDFEGKLNLNDKIKIIPFKWTDTEKQTLKPLYYIHSKSKDNDLFCVVNTVYYGKVEH